MTNKYLQGIIQKRKTGDAKEKDRGRFSVLNGKQKDRGRFYVLTHKIAHCKNIAEFQHLEEKQRIKYVQNLKVKGLSVRQISRLTGTGKGLVEKWLKI